MKTTRKANTKELFLHAHNLMHLLNSKLISTEEAKAQSNLLKQANNLLKYELDRAVNLKKYENLDIREIEEFEENENE